MSEWISVKDMPIPKDRDILVFSENRSVSCVWCRDVEHFIPNCECDGWEHSWGKIDASHWMPLPNPPKSIE
jgi:hypothetical protein